MTSVGVVTAASPHPRTSFVASDGRRVEFVQNGFVSRARGAEVSVACRFSDPEGAAIAATSWTPWAAPAWMLLPGLAFTLAPLFAAEVVAGPRRPRPPPR